MSDDLDEAVRDLRETLTRLGTPERAEHEKRYLKSSITHLGVGVPQLRQAVRAWWGDLERRAVAAGAGDMRSAADLLWEPAVYEMRSASVELLRYRVKLLTPADLAACERRIREARTWALVDPMSTDVVWAISTAPKAARRCGPVLDRWAIDGSFWVRRAALLSQLRVVRPADGDPRRFLRYADRMLDEREFFIRKAIGWVLRDMGRRRPQLVYNWLLPRVARASGVTFREAVKHLPADQAAELNALR